MYFTSCTYLKTVLPPKSIYFLTLSFPSQNKTAQAKAKCFLKLTTSKSVVLLVHHLLDVCGPLKEMSLLFQQQDSCIAEIHRTLKSTVAVIQKLKSRLLKCKITPPCLQHIMVVLISDLLELVMLNDNKVRGIFFAFTVMENT